MYLVSQGHNLQYVGVRGMTALEEAVEDFLKIDAENNEIHNLLKEQGEKIIILQLFISLNKFKTSYPSTIQLCYASSD